jgi:Cof subfamily protein (haloacid dehalogenase superfamily)
MAPRLIASDLDGTLLRSDGSVSQRTVDAIAAVQEAGIGWVVATARPPRWMDDLSDIVGRGGVAICSNGAFVYDVARRIVVAERTLHATATSELVEDLRVAVPDIAFALERQDGFAREHAFVDEYREGTGRRADSALDLLDRPVGKLLARSPSLENAIFLATVAEVVGDRAVMAYSGATGLAEISAAGVTKASVLDAWCTELGIPPEDVWAFGDMPNDLAMLRWAGTSYAVANAHPDVRAAADRVIADNDEDGVAQVLESLVLTRAVD